MALARRLTVPQALAVRMNRQGLAAHRSTDVAHAVRTAAGVQAQDLGASRLAVRARTHGLDQNAVVRACDVDRTVVRTSLMRGTIHAVAAEDVRWLVALLGPALRAGDRRRRKELGLDDETCSRALKAIPSVLAGGPLTRADLVSGLAAEGVPIEASGQAPAHLVFYAAASGLICRGPDRGAESTCVLLDEWIPSGPAGPEGDEARLELARRYLAAFSPATAEDFAAWSGLPVGSARKAMTALADEVDHVSVAGTPMLLPGDTLVGDTGAGQGIWRLLPAFDTYLLGYRSRELALDKAFARRIHAGGGWIHPSVVRDGQVMGTWRLRRTGGRTAVAVELFPGRGRAAADPPAQALAAEVVDLGRFLGVPTELQLVADAGH
jgi:hypothetical protein